MSANPSIELHHRHHYEEDGDEKELELETTPFRRSINQLPEFSTAELRKTARRFEQQNESVKSAGSKSYYQQQLGLVEWILSRRKSASLTELESGTHATKENSKPNTALVNFAISLSFWCNVGLLFIKVIAFFVTGSFAILGSALDSALDILSGLTLYLAKRFMQRKDSDLLSFPLGAAAAESIGIVVFSTIQGITSIQLIVFACQFLSAAAGDPSKQGLELNVEALVFLGVTITVKMLLVAFFLFLGSSNSVAEAYLQDHCNDVISNTIAVAAVLLASYIREAWWVDATAGMLFASFILYSWTVTGLSHVRLLLATSAPFELLQEITYIASTFNKKVIQVDTVRAHHFGSLYLVEVHLVLPEDMLLREAHDIGDQLEQELEQLENVLRAYVHLDWEVGHKPEYLRAHATQRLKNQ